MTKMKIYFFIFKKVCKRGVCVCIHIYIHTSLQQQRKILKGISVSVSASIPLRADDIEALLYSDTA